MKGFELKFQYVNIEIEQTHNGFMQNVIIIVKLFFILSWYAIQEVVNYVI
jgi:hypothetical protein